MTVTLAPSATDVANPAPQLFRIEDLAISPLNVRFNEEDCAAVEALQASIVAEGLLQPLVLHPVPEGAKWAERPSSSEAVGQRQEPARFGVLAGGRRYRAISRAIASGDLPPDFPIHATVRDLPDGAIILLSLTENLLRRDLQPYETHRAIARAHAEGLSIDDIATQTGQKRAWVARHLRLGELEPEILAAYIAGDVSMHQAMAYAATEDRLLQREAWVHFAALNAYERTPAAIRTFLKVGDHEIERNLLFVGEAIYRGNGGRYELDLFADGPERGRVTDEPLLARLVAEKMEVVRNQVRAEWGERELRFAPRPPERLGFHDRDLEVRGRKSSSSRQAVGQISSDWESIRIPRNADPDDFLATIEIEGNGDWTARLWWKSHAAKATFEKRATPARAQDDDETFQARALRNGSAEGAALERGSAYEAEARRIVRDQHGLTADGVNVVRAIRRDLLRYALLCTPERDVPMDYLVWSALRQEFTRARPAETGARGLAGEGYTVGEREPGELMADQRTGQSGHDFWSVCLADLRTHPAFAVDDAAAALRAYLSAEPALKRTAEAILAGMALVRSMASPGWEVPAHEVLAEKILASSSALRSGWTPTAAFTGLFGKLARQSMVAPFVDEAERRALAKARDRDLSRRTAEILAAQPSWLHPLLAFGEPEASPGVEHHGYLEEVAEQREQEPVA